MTYSGLIKDYMGYGTHANRPATPNVGTGVSVLYYETDTTNTFVWTGSAWTQINRCAWTLIDDQVLSSAATTVSFATISGNYKHLYLEAEARSSANTGGTSLIMQCNSDTGSNYGGAIYGHYASGINSTFTVGGTSVPIGYCAGGNVGNSAQAAVSGVWLPDYVGTTFWKAFHGNWSLFNGTAADSQQTGTCSGEWQSTSAITRIDLALSSGDFVAGSRFTLWGVS